MSDSKLPSISASSALPPEIMEAILCFLPAKSLGRFKSVSKTWNSLISHPQFIKKHLQHHQLTTKVILLSPAFSLYTLDTNQLLPYLNINSRDNIPATVKELSFRSPFRWEQILASCNGLLLATTDTYHFLYVLNPTTQERWKVPLPTFSHPEREYFVKHGFGYDASTNDYKIVTVLFTDPESKLSFDSTDTYVSVYSLRNSSWKRSRNSPYDHATFHLVKGALVNKKFHWLISSSTIVGFNFETEQFNEIRLQLPDSYKKRNIWFYDMVEVRGKLGVCIEVFQGCELWVMEEYGVGNSWNRVCLHHFIRTVWPVCLVGGGSNRDIVVVEDENEVFVFNIDESRRRNLRIEGGPDRFTVGGTYVESLESPGCIL